MKRHQLFFLAAFLFARPIFSIGSDKIDFTTKDLVDRWMKKIPAKEVCDKEYCNKLAPGQKLDSISISEFYIMKGEVTNAMYYWFTEEIRKSGDSDSWRNALPDTLVWREKLAYNEPYVEYYFRHPAYANYPVVGVSYAQAEIFCAFATKWYNQLPKRKFKKVRFDLPSETQWVYAADAGASRKMFTWSGVHMRNEEGKVMANFYCVPEHAIIRDTVDGKPMVRLGTSVEDHYEYFQGYDILAPSLSYFPNEFGLYNMCGNAAEFVKGQNFTKGGSWRDTGFYLRLAVRQAYQKEKSASSQRGFRMIMVVEEM